MGQDRGEVWRADLEAAYTLFATDHQDRLTSKVLLEAALGAMRQQADVQIEMPEFAERLGAQSEDLERLLAATTALLRVNRDANGEQLRDAAIGALVRLRPDGHTRYWSRAEDVPFRAVLAGDAGLTSKLVPGDVGYVRWTGWVRNDAYRISDAVRRRLDALLHEGARAWLFDLRGNMGGNGTESQCLASMFLDGEPLWVYRYPDRVERVSADRAERLPDSYQLPIAVIIDENSWSASETFTFALRQHGRARVVGERSGGRLGKGKGRTLPGGGFLVVAIASTTGPHGEIYNGVGITPDVVVPSGAALDVAVGELVSKMT
jgi:hypothetical protein